MNESRVFMLNGTDVQKIVTRLEGSFAPRRVWRCKVPRLRRAMLCRRASRRTDGKR